MVGVVSQVVIPVKKEGEKERVFTIVCEVVDGPHHHHHNHHHNHHQYSHEEEEIASPLTTRLWKMASAWRVISFFLVVFVLPTVLISLPLYARYHLYHARHLPMTETDTRALDHAVSSFWCQGQRVSSNGSLDAFLVSGAPKVKEQRRHISLKRNLTLTHDDIEYWGVYLLQGSSFSISSSARWPGGVLLVVQGEENLRKCFYRESRVEEQLQNPGAVYKGTPDNEPDDDRRKKTGTDRGRTVMDEEHHWLEEEDHENTGGEVFDDAPLEDFGAGREHHLPKNKPGSRRRLPLNKETGAGNVRQVKDIGAGNIHQVERIGAGNVRQIEDVGAGNIRQIEEIGAGNVRQFEEDGDDEVDVAVEEDRDDTDVDKKELSPDEDDKDEEDEPEDLHKYDLEGKLKNRRRKGKKGRKNKNKKKNREAAAQRGRTRRSAVLGENAPGLSNPGLTQDGFDTMENFNHMDDLNHMDNFNYMDNLDHMHNFDRMENFEHLFNFSGFVTAGESSYSSSEEFMENCRNAILMVDLTPFVAWGEHISNFNAANKSADSWTFHANSSDYFYFIFTSDNSFERNDIGFQLDLFRATYDVSSPIETCRNSTECVFPLAFTQTEAVVVEVPAGEELLELHSFEVTTACQPRVPVYMVFILLVPFIILLFAFQ